MPRVEVVLAVARSEALVTLDLPPGATLRDAVRASGLVAGDDGAVGVFGERRDAGDPAREGDRIEIYRPLPLDPREMRRRAARRKP